MTKMTQAEQIKTFLSQNDYKSALKVASKSRYTKGNLHKIKSAYEKSGNSPLFHTNQNRNLHFFFDPTQVYR